ncbi:hypothetical protein AX15_001812 [Amanita polypyramis BW_CC]|nr:hypothetical protein AX15_001812 [Amanita polypyramis BW_CC]
MSESQWHRSPDAPCPYVLSERITFKKLGNAAFQSVAAFPWSRESIHVLWEGRQELIQERWDSMITTYADAVATATESVVVICFFQDEKRFIEFTLPPRLEIVVPIQSDAIHLAWALSPLSPYEPLLVVGRLHTVYILNVNKPGAFAYLVGHGGAITFIAVHPIHPHIFATTSRDFTTRIYDLTLPPRQEEDAQYNPNLLPLKQPSRAGPAFGLNMNEREGVGMGRCVVLLMGGRSGGHNAAVLGAAFHSSKPLIATCGLDRAVKIWALPPSINSLQMSRQDKPLFSSVSVHRARVLSINWLSDDILLSHSAPAVLRPNCGEKNEVHEYTTEAGELILWCWLSLNRFFPPELRTYRQPLYPSLRDWEDSSSFQVLFKGFIPYSGELSQLITPTLFMYTLHPHLPTSGSVVLLIYPDSTSFRLLHVPDSFRQRNPPRFPLDEPDKSEIILDGLNLESRADFISGWLIDIAEDSVPKLNACAIPPGGNMIIAIGTQGTLWRWTIR